MMDNRIIAPSLPNVSGSRLNGNQGDFPTEALESTLDNLLEVGLKFFLKSWEILTHVWRIEKL